MVSDQLGRFIGEFVGSPSACMGSFWVLLLQTLSTCLFAGFCVLSL